MVELKDKDRIMSKQSVGSSSPLACIAVRPDEKPYAVTASVNRASCVFLDIYGLFKMVFDCL